MSRQHFKIGKGISLTPVASRPTDPENGDVIYNSTTNLVERYENGTWKNSLTGAVNDTLSNLVSPTAVNQDLIFNKTIALVKTADTTGVGSETLSVLTGSVTTTGSSGSLTLGSGPSASASGTVSLTSGSTTLTGSTTGAITVRSGNAGTGNTSSGSVTIATGTSTGTNVTGALTLQTGQATGLAGSGNITVNSGNVTTNTSGSSGIITISSGTSVAGATGTTGSVSLASGNHASASTSTGTVTVTSGNQTGTAFSGTGGVTTITTGNITSATATGTTGGTNILTGNTAGSGGATGAVTLRSGNATSTGNSGAVILQTGSVTTGVRGSINMVDGSLASSAAGYVWTLANTATGAGNWQAISSPSKNIIVNGNADNATTSIFVPYQDSSGSRPADGTGGTTTGITTSVSSTAALTNLKSFLLTKDAANRQGGGWAIPFTVDPAHRAKVLTIDIDYIVNSGTFVPGTSAADSDIIWYIYDVTNSQLIEPSNIKLLSNSTTLSDKFSASFQTSATGSSYRLIAHIATTSAAAYELKVEVAVSPSNYVFGSPVTDWQSVTMSGNLTTNTVYSAKRARVGDSYKYNVQVSFTGTPNAAGIFALNLPAGDVIDTSKLSSGGSLFNFESNIEGRVGIAAGSAYEGGVMLNGSTSVVISWFDTNGNGNYVAHNSPTALAAGHYLNIEFTVPIVGLSSSVQMSDSADTRAVSVYKLSALPTGTINGGYNAVIWSSITGDTHGGYNSGTGRYTVRVPGYYRVTATLDINGTFTAGQYIGVRAVNVTTGDSVYNFWRAQTSITGDFPISATGVIYAKAGDVLGVDSISSGSSLSFSGSLSGNHFAFDLIQGPSTIAVSEKIDAIYKTSAGQSLGAGTVIVDFGTKEEDSHGLVTTGGSWKFTSRTNRVYKITGALRADSNPRRFDLYKNGAFFRCLFEPSAASETEAFSTSIRLNDGDFIDIRANTGSAASLFADDRFNYVCISAE